MFTVYCINTTVIVLAPNGKLSGEILKSREAAIDMYMWVAEDLACRDVLDSHSAILN